ncbi:MAG: hypothetical protein ABL877_05985 [Thiobacillus sp.]
MKRHLIPFTCLLAALSVQTAWAGKPSRNDVKAEVATKASVPVEAESPALDSIMPGNQTAKAEQCDSDSGACKTASTVRSMLTSMTSLANETAPGYEAETEQGAAAMEKGMSLMQSMMGRLLR